VLFAGSVAENVARGRAQNVFQPVLSLEEAMEQALAEKKSTPCGCLSNNGANTHSLVATSEEGADLESGSKALSATALGEVEDACRASNAHDFITTFPNKYDTDIGEGSIMVSGGQKQRIAIARALVKKPAVLLLDEATSALDAASEKMVQQSIDELSRSKAQTTIVIAHRLSTIRNADKIFVVDQGKYKVVVVCHEC
jgi:ABC-type multidrug transport system fused ATPase/permease subunit